MKKNKFLLMSLVIGGWLILSAGRSYGQSSTNYKLENYQFGGGGGFNINSTSYSLEGILGEVAGQQSSTNFKLNSGLIFAQNASVPPAPTIVNSSNWYNKLLITINKSSGDASDTTYAIAISTDNFVSDVRYVQSNNTVGSSLTSSNFQTYTAWGGSSGSYIIGLSTNTTYYVKVAASHGKYTQSDFGPIASAATVGEQVSFDIDIGGSTDPGETSPPYAIDFGNLTVGLAKQTPQRPWLDFATNAESGGWIYVYDQNTGLKSTVANYTINSATADLDLSGVTEGFGLQDTALSQTSGGPLGQTSPYDQANNKVGVVDTTVREIFNTSNNPIVGGRAAVRVKAKISSATPGAADYVDTITFLATGSF